MELMDRKLKEIGQEHYDYVMKIYTEADGTTKQLKEQDNAMLQTIRHSHIGVSSYLANIYKYPF